MKLLIFFLTLFSLNIISAQSWSYKSGGNAFDGKYKTANVKGKGTNFPYHEPLLVINLFNEESLNFYLSGAGYYSSSSEIEVLWIFNNEPKTIYSSENLTTSDDGKIIFFSGFRNNNTNDYLAELEFIDKLKTASKIDVRVKSSYGKNDVSFGLSGSTKAIDYVISKKYKDKRIAALEKYMKNLEAEVERDTEINSRISKLLLPAGVLEDELEKVLHQIDFWFDLHDLNMNDIDSLNFDFANYSIQLNLFDSNKNLLKKLDNIGSYMPNSREKMENDIKAKEEKEIEMSIQKISKLLDRYEFTDIEKKVILDKIKSQFKTFSTNFEIRKANDTLKNPWILSSIDSISIPINDSSISQVNLLTKKGKGLSFVYGFGLIPDRILDKIEEETVEAVSIKIIDYIKKYGLTDEENLKVVDRALSSIKIYFEYDMSFIKNIELEVVEKSSKDIEIKFITSDETVIRPVKMYNEKEIAKKLKKLKKLQN